MKGFQLAFLVLLASVLSAHFTVAIRGFDVPRYCCIKVRSQILPWRMVQGYELTRNSCPIQAVIFITKRGLKTCAPPKEEWVKRYISLLKAQSQL